MAHLIVPQRATNTQSPIDPTLPMTCTIESSYVINGHGVRNQKFVIIYLQINLGIFYSSDTSIQ